MSPEKIAVRIQAIVRQVLPKEYTIQIRTYHPNSITKGESGVDFEIHHSSVKGRIGGFVVDRNGVAYRLEPNFGENRHGKMLRRTAGIRAHVRSVVNYAIEQVYAEISQQEAA